MKDDAHHTITSSRFKRVVARKKDVTDSFLSSLFDAKPFDHVAAINHGVVNEQRAVQSYMISKERQGQAVHVRS